MAMANTRAMIIACRIFGAAEGLRPSARMLAYPIEAITAEGPMIVTNITRKMMKLSNARSFHSSARTIHSFSSNFTIPLRIGTRVFQSTVT